MNIQKIVLIGFISLQAFSVKAQQVLVTGGQRMPNEWIDSETHHKVVRLTRREGSTNMGFYFHNNPFIGNKMVYYSSNKTEISDLVKQEVPSTNIGNKQIHILDLNTLQSEQLTYHKAPMGGEIVHAKSGRVFYQIKDSVFSVNVVTKEVKKLFVFPSDFRAGVTTVNADGTLLAGAWSGDQEKEILRLHPQKGDFFNLIYEAKLP
jgi:oligogalacturonide lyase